MTEIERLRAELNAAKSRLADLEKQEPAYWLAAGIFCFPEKKEAEEHAAHVLGSNKPAIPLYTNPVAQAGQVPEGLADLCRFLAVLYCELDELRYSTARLPAEQIADALICKWPVLQGTRNQLNIKRISEQPYDQSKLHAGIAAMLDAAPAQGGE